MVMLVVRVCVGGLGERQDERDRQGNRRRMAVSLAGKIVTV